MKAYPELFVWLVGTWVILCICSAWLLLATRNVALRNRLLPVCIWGAGFLFAGFVFLLSGELRVMLIVTPAVVLICFLNLRTMKICQACGRTVYNNVLLTKMEYCSKCGAKLPQT